MIIVAALLSVGNTAATTDQEPKKREDGSKEKSRSAT
jgi:hypothetical protein